jgi:nicotinamide mononucleotide transporter
VEKQVDFAIPIFCEGCVEMSVVTTLLDELRATSPWEAVAVVLGLLYLVLAVKRSLWCWLCAFVSTAIYLVLFVNTALYMHVLLQVFYLAMAVYGYLDWRTGRSDAGEVVIRSWTVRQHTIAIVVMTAATLVNGWLLSKTADVSPYLDSFVTWGSVVTTWMVARRVIENWLYWLIVDAIAAYLYFTQGLVLTTLLFVIYLGIVVHGYFAWRRDRAAQEVAVAVPLAAGEP